MFIEDSGLPWDISYESEIALVLQKFGNSSGGFLSFYINISITIRFRYFLLITIQLNILFVLISQNPLSIRISLFWLSF